jgi:hypothetical protein
MNKIDFDDFQDEEGAGGQGHQGSQSRNANADTITEEITTVERPMADGELNNTQMNALLSTRDD